MKNRPQRQFIERIQAISAASMLPQGASMAELTSRLEVNRKTLYRDLTYLRDRLNLPLVYCRRKWRWFMVKKVRLCRCCGGRVA